MSPNGIDFADYHRTVVGYHGTTLEAAERLVAGAPFTASDETDEWFGRGVYFWEHAYQQAWAWADRNGAKNAAVVGAVIRLGFCFDLLDPGNVGILKGYHDKMVDDMQARGETVPVNVRSRKYLDCAVFNYMFRRLEMEGSPIDTARAAYVPASKRNRVYPGSWISDETHIQISVRNPASIVAVWHIQRNGKYGIQAVQVDAGDSTRGTAKDSEPNTGANAPDSR